MTMLLATWTPNVFDLVTKLTHPGLALAWPALAWGCVIKIEYLVYLVA
jgi:hypothetical protein